MLQTYEYDAFGNQKNAVETDPNPFRYCAEYWDKETKTVYLRNRSYNPASGRFSREDPIGSGLNWYSYCGGNPVRFIDPTGLVGQSIHDYYYGLGYYGVENETSGYAEFYKYDKNGNKVIEIYGSKPSPSGGTSSSSSSSKNNTVSAVHPVKSNTSGTTVSVK